MYVAKIKKKMMNNIFYYKKTKRQIYKKQKEFSLKPAKE